jgi:hypothetical protein
MMSNDSMPKLDADTHNPNLYVPGELYREIGTKMRILAERVSSKKTNTDINVEFEIRLGKYESDSDRNSFVPGVTYEEFSRFYTFLEENYQKVDIKTDLDIIAMSLGQFDKDKNQVRITISGSENIMKYCSTSVVPFESEDVSFQVKSRIPQLENTDIGIYDIRLSASDEHTLPLEMVLNLNETDSLEVLNRKVNESMKKFRYKKRISYLSQDGLFRYDITQTKQINDSKTGIKLEKSLRESVIFNQQPIYEVEAELVYKDKADNIEKITDPTFKDSVLSHITNLLQIRHDTELVLSNLEKENILIDFLSLYLDKSTADAQKDFKLYYNRKDKQYNKMFPGAKVSTLELVSLFKKDAKAANKPYIFEDYTVTDKADGERFILFISKNNCIFLVNDRMDVLRTDIQLEDESDKLHSTMLDGELVITVENGVKVYNYYAFDIIFKHREPIFKNPLFPRAEKNRSSCRSAILENVVSRIQKVPSPMIDGVRYFNIAMKNLRSIKGEDIERMRNQCGLIWNHREEAFKYELDGLIFTPKFDEYPIGKLWANALKWKPPQENSIDFLIKFRKDEIQTVVEGGVAHKYQLADLYVGENVEKKGRDGPHKEYVYVEKMFDIPNTLSKEPTYLIKVPVNSTGSKDEVVVRSETIVECVWNSGWKVLRTRLDKTQRFLASGKKISGTANNFSVAVSIWSTIVEPINTDVLTGLVPLLTSKKEYYSNSGTYLTEPVRSFNNYVKALLIGGGRLYGKSLIDFSCGRGGDLKKWFISKYERVVGLDYSKVGIESMDPAIGALGRIDSMKKNNPAFAKWADNVKLFWADTSKIVSGHVQNGICNEKQRELAKPELEKKFDVGVSFFTAHYYFESPSKIRGFFQNLFDNVNDKGVAIITCFDGLEMFNWLDGMPDGQIYSGLVKSKTVWQIKKGYNKHTPFLPDSNNVGLKIDIKFESISDDYYSEYLVHPEYLIKMAKKYGFNLISDEDALLKFNLPKSTALFGELMDNLQEPSQMDNLRQSALGRVYYEDINNLINDGDYVQLRHWTKRNRYFIFEKSTTSAAEGIATGWRKRLSTYDCDTEYDSKISQAAAEAEAEEAEAEESVQMAPVFKKKLTRKQTNSTNSSVAQSTEVVSAPLDNSESTGTVVESVQTAPALKKKVSVAKKVVTSELSSESNFVKSVESVEESAQAPKAPLLKKKLTKKQTDSTNSSVTQSTEVVSAPLDNSESTGTVVESSEPTPPLKKKVSMAKKVVTPELPSESNATESSLVQPPKKKLVKKASIGIPEENENAPLSTLLKKKSQTASLSTNVDESAVVEPVKKKAVKKAAASTEEPISKPVKKVKTLKVPVNVLQMLQSAMNSNNENDEVPEEVVEEAPPVLEEPQVKKILIPKSLLTKGKKE